MYILIIGEGREKETNNSNSRTIFIKNSQDVHKINSVAYVANKKIATAVAIQKHET